MPKKPATITTKEPFPGDLKKADINGLIDLRILAGAIRSTAAKDAEGDWIITTEWNVIGGNG